MRNEGGAGVEEDTHEHREHSQRQHIHREDVILHHQRYQYREYRNKTIYHCQRTWLLEIVGTEQVEIYSEDAEYYEDEHNAPPHRRLLTPVAEMLLHLRRIGIELAQGLVLYYLSTVNNSLTLLHLTALSCNKGNLTAQFVITAYAVIFQV